VPPLVYYYPDDPNVRDMADQKLLGRDLMVAAVTKYGGEGRCVYLPAGEWVDVHTGQRYHSDGAWFGPFPTQVDTPEGTRFRLPTFARAGAIVPQMHVDERTMNAAGQRTDGSRRDELIVRVYADQAPSTFTLYEDDGRTVAYQRGEVRTTALSQVQTEDEVTVTIDTASGSYDGAPGARDNIVDLSLDRAQDVGEVSLEVAGLGRIALLRHETPEAFAAAPSGWYIADSRRVIAKSGQLDVATSKVFTFAFAVPPSETQGPDYLAYLPAIRDASNALPVPLTGQSCYDSRACCEQEIACPNRAYVPLVRSP
jgi:hypothetical protein